jgi:hypothetical protein
MPKRNIPLYTEDERKFRGEEEVYSNYQKPKIQAGDRSDYTGAIIAKGVSDIAFKAYEQRLIEENNKASLAYLDKKEKLQYEIDSGWDGYDTEKHISYFNERHDVIDREVLDGISSGEVKRAWTQKLKQNRAEWSPKVRAQGWKRQADRGIKTGIATMDAWEKQAGNASTDTEYEAAIGELAGVLKGLSAAGYVTDEWSQNQLEARLDRIGGIYLKNQVDTYFDSLDPEQDPSMVVELIAVSPIFDETDEKVQRDILDYAARKGIEIKNKRETMTRTQKVLYTQAADDAESQLEQTGRTSIDMPKMIRDTFTTEDDVTAETLLWQRRENLAKGKNNVNNIIRAMPFADAAGYLNSLKIGAKDNSVNSALSEHGFELLARRQKILDADPASYILSYNPGAASNPDLMIYEQTRLGVPEYKLSILTNSEKEAIVMTAAINTAEKNKAMFQNLRERYPNHMGRVVNELKAAKLPSGLAAAINMTQPGQQNVAEILMEVHTFESDELLDTASKHLGVNKNKINKMVDRELIDISEEMKRVMMNTFGFRKEGVEQLRAFDEMVRKAAYSMMVKNGMSPDKATEEVVNQIVHGSYELSDDKNYYVPKSPEVGVSPDMVEDAGDFVLSNLTIDMLPDYDADGNKLYRNTRQKQQALEVLKSTAILANTPDMTGVMIVRSSGDVFGTAEGKPVVLTWNDIRKGKYKPAPEPEKAKEKREPFKLDSFIDTKSMGEAFEYFNTAGKSGKWAPKPTGMNAVYNQTTDNKIKSIAETAQIPTDVSDNVRKSMKMISETGGLSDKAAENLKSSLDQLENTEIKSELIENLKKSIKSGREGGELILKRIMDLFWWLDTKTGMGGK